VSVSSKNTVHLSAEHTNEIKATTEGEKFTPVDAGGKLPDKFFSDFLERQGLKLKGAGPLENPRTDQDGIKRS